MDVNDRRLGLLLPYNLKNPLGLCILTLVCINVNNLFFSPCVVVLNGESSFVSALCRVQYCNHNR